jgi:iron-sulfur cluster assembly accessory protein
MTLTSVTIEDETPQVQSGVTLTETAAGRVRSLIEEKDLEGHALRVFVSGGGCSGLQYGMALEGQPRETDLRYTFDGIDVVIDPQSINYLHGATIDYIDDLMGGGFKIENPNAVSSCGCGHSFRTSNDGGAAASAAGCNC